VNESTGRPICGVAHSLPPTACFAQPAGYGGAQHAARDPAFTLADPFDRSRRSLARAWHLDLLV